MSSGRDVGLDRFPRGGVLVDDHSHTLLTVVGLTAEDPDGLCVVDEHVEDRCERFRASNGNETRFQTRSCWCAQVSGDRFAGLSE